MFEEMRVGARVHRSALLAVAVAALLVGAACAPPVSPAPTVRPQPEGRGKVTDVAVAPSAGCGHASLPSQLDAGRSTLTVPTAQGPRTTLLDLPAGMTGDDPRPVLLSLHPFSLDATVWDAYSGLADAATARGYVVLTPFGSQPGPRWAVPGGLETGTDDIAFLSAALDLVEDTLCIDRNQEFAAGFSAGAAMAQALSCTLPWRVAAVAASGGANLTDTCPDSPGTDVMILHGSADPIAPTSGSTVVFAPPLGLSVDDVVAVDAARAGCAATPVVDHLFPSVTVDRYVGCGDGRRVEYWRLAGAGHTWAGAPTPGIVELVTGPTNHDISANDEVLDFFDAAGPAS